MRLVPIKCAWCNRRQKKPAGAVNRARKIGAPLFCDKACAGLHRRKGKTVEQKKAEKREYDKVYRALNIESITAKKAAYFKRTYDPDKARIERKKRMPKHVEYCRRPEYKAWKREYDQQYQGRKFGPFAEAWHLTKALNREIKKRSSNYEIRLENRTWAKAQQRDREAQGQRRGRDHPPAHGE